MLKAEYTISMHWDLTVFYSGIDDPRIDADLAMLTEQARRFRDDYKGKLSEKLGDAIADYAEMQMLLNKILVYVFLKQSLNTADAAVNAKIAAVERELAALQGEYLTFFNLELVALDDTALELLYKENAVVAQHRPWIEHQRIFKPHLLSEAVESALVKRSPFGPGSWSEFFDECESDLRFNFKDGTKTLTEMLDTLTVSKDKEERSEALKTVNDGLAGAFAKYSAQTLYMVAGEEAVERKERGYRHPMEARNKLNRISDEAVTALHRAVTETAAPLARRYYTLKASLLGMKTLAWSDRNAPMPFVNAHKIPFDEAAALVLKVYQSFSPTLARIVQKFIDEKRVDAPAAPGKRGGAFNYSVVLPGRQPASFTFLNYLGSDRDVMVLAHELGHGVHGILAGEAQGPLMFHAPIAYCETASVFGEMTAFNFLKEQLVRENDIHALLALVMGKIDDILNTVVRQIGFSNFERRLHGMDASYGMWEVPRKRSAEELDALWLRTLQEMYGKEGEVFTYENAEHLWAYVSHFNRPFYVYGYAFGELLTQSLYAKRAALGSRFEPLYRDLLRSGDTKNATELLAPFGLDPADASFWTDGIAVSLGTMIKEAEGLAKQATRDI